MPDDLRQALLDAASPPRKGLDKNQVLSRGQSLRRRRLFVITSSFVVLLGLFFATPTVFFSEFLDRSAVTERGPGGEAEMATSAVVATIPVPGAPTCLAEGAGSVWVGGSDGAGKFLVSRIDSTTNLPVATVGLPGFPIDMQFAEGHLWVLISRVGGGGGWISRIDAATNKIVNPPLSLDSTPTDLSIGAGYWAAAEGGRLLEIAADGSRIVRQRELGADGVAVSGGRVWTFDTQGTLTPVDSQSRETSQTISLEPNVVQVVATGSELWVMQQTPEEQMRLTLVTLADDGSSKTSSADLPLGPGAFLPHEGGAWVLLNGESIRGGAGEAVHIDLDSGQVTERVAVGGAPMDVVVAAEDLWVANFNDHTVSRIHSAE